MNILSLLTSTLIVLLFPLGVYASPAPSETLRQQFYDAHCHMIQEQYPDASVGFEKLVGKYPVMEDYVRYYLARSLMGEKKYTEAIKHWEGLLKNSPQSRLMAEARIALADCYFQLGEFAKANANYQKQPLSDGTEDARRLLHSGLCFEWEQKFKKAGETYYKLWSYYPSTEYADRADIRLSTLREQNKIPGATEKVHFKRIISLIKLWKCSEAIPDIKAFIKKFPGSKSIAKAYSKLGSCYRSIRDYENAIKTYRKLIELFKGTDLAAEGYYYLSSIYWNKNMERNPRTNLWVIASRYPNSKWADKALFMLGRIEENKKRNKKAINAYDTLSRKYPRSEKTAEALWRIGWIYYQQGKYGSGAKYLMSAATSSKSLSLRNSSLYWRGRCLEKVNKREAAISSYRKVLKNNYRGYYAHLARKRFYKLQADPGPSPLPQDPPPSADLFTLPPCNSHKWPGRLAKVRELSAMEFFPEAALELQDLNKKGCRDRDFWVGLSKLYLHSHDYRRSIQALYRVYHDDMPRAFWRLLYPKNFGDTIQRQAQLYDLDPYLVLALMRQESVFDQLSLSPANAYGLMQIIPPTARRIAKALNQADGFIKEMLYDPEVNIPFGTWYMSNLLKEFEGDVILALAAYNAGEKASYKWRRKNNKDDPYRFIENISYPETRKYVKQVLKNYENYLWLYEEKNNNF